MKDEIKEILEALDNTACCPYHDDMCKKAKNCITNLEQKVEQYENPDDYTLFYMWLDAKAKDKMKQLQEENEIKTTKLNAIRKYLLNNKLYTFKYDDEELFEITTDKKAKDDLLKILGGDVE